MKDPIIHLILAIVILMGLLLLTMGLAEPVANGGGTAHPEIPGMQAGGDGAARLQYIGGYGFVFHGLLLALITALCALGVRKERRGPKLLAAMVASLLLTWFVAWQMYSGHQRFLESGETEYFMGFPIATAWAVYGTWLGAIPLILLYSLGFRHLVFTPGDEEKYRQLLERKNNRDN